MIDYSTLAGEKMKAASRDDPECERPETPNDSKDQNGGQNGLGPGAGIMRNARDPSSHVKEPAGMSPTRVHGSASRSTSAGAGVAVVLGVAALFLGTTMLGNRRRYQLGRVREFPDSAPVPARRAIATRDVVTANAVTIRRPRAELYAFWRDFENLPRFMENIREVRVLGGGRSEWMIAGPAGTSFTLLTEITEEREGERIAWRTLPESDIEAEGAVDFRDMPGDRGTAIEATVRYRPPGGTASAWIAKLFQREPNVQGRRELRRLKMLMEAGEIATASNHRDAS
jgi:uncharacterized membrane protein